CANRGRLRLRGRGSRRSRSRSGSARSRRTRRGSASSARSAGAGEALDSLEELLGLRVRVGLVAGGEGAGHAVADVLVEDPEGERFEGGVDGGDLGEDVDAVAVLLDHPLDAADLAFDAVE